MFDFDQVYSDLKSSDIDWTLCFPTTHINPGWSVEKNKDGDYVVSWADQNTVFKTEEEVQLFLRPAIRNILMLKELRDMWETHVEGRGWEISCLALMAYKSRAEDLFLKPMLIARRGAERLCLLPSMLSVLCFVYYASSSAKEGETFTDPSRLDSLPEL